MIKMKIDYILTDEKNEDFENLTEELDKYFYSIFGDLTLEYEETHNMEGKHYFCIAYHDKKAISSSCFKILNNETVEMKRFHVLKDYQNKNIGSKMISKLENLAKDLNFKYSILETGSTMGTAINFYKKNGYKLIDNFEPFIGDENIVCMKKKL